MNSRFIAFLYILVLLTACAQLPKFDTRQVDKNLFPSHIAHDIKNLRGKTVMWGGTIISGKNLKDSTRLEVLAYPLDGDGWPGQDQKPLGRFFLSEQGYLETADYSKGRIITVVGTVQDIEQGKVGESPYIYPVLQSQQLHLWDKIDQKSNTGVQFGIGIMFR